MITRQEFRDWLANPVTKCIFETLEEDRALHMELLLNATPNYPAQENCMIALGKLMGNINSLKSILNISYDDIEPEGEKEDE